MSQWFHFGLNGSVDEIKPQVSVGNPSFMIHKRHLIQKDLGFFRTALPWLTAVAGRGAKVAIISRAWFRTTGTIYGFSATEMW